MADADDGGAPYVFHMASADDDGGDNNEDDDDVADIAGLLSQAGAITDRAFASGKLEPRPLEKEVVGGELPPAALNHEEVPRSSAVTTMPSPDPVGSDILHKMEHLQTQGVHDAGLAMRSRAATVEAAVSTVGAEERLSDELPPSHHVSPTRARVLASEHEASREVLQVAPSKVGAEERLSEELPPSHHVSPTRARVHPPREVVLLAPEHEAPQEVLQVVPKHAPTSTHKDPPSPAKATSSPPPSTPLVTSSPSEPPTSPSKVPHPPAATRPPPQRHQPPRDSGIRTVHRSTRSADTAQCKVAYVTALRQLAKQEQSKSAGRSSVPPESSLSHWTVDAAVDHLVQLAHDKTSGEAFGAPRTDAATPVVDPALDKLSRPKPRHPSNHRAFTTIEDARECRFRPKKTRASVRAMQNPACGYDFVSRNDGDDDTKKDFIGRMDAAEMNRQKRLETTRGEEAYNVRQNKKQCPKCGMVQSFAEWRDKKRKCTFCGVAFALPKAWGDISHAFLDRMEEWGQHHEANQLKIRQAVTLLDTTNGMVAKSSRQKLLEKRLASRHTDDPLAFIHDYLRQKQRQPARNGQRRVHVPANLQDKLLHVIAAAASQPATIHRDKG